MKNLLNFIFPKKENHYPDFALEYLHCFNQSLDFSLPLNNVTFVILDTETTGLDPKKDKIISVGAVKVRNKTIDISKSLSIYSKNYTIINKDAISIHGTLPDHDIGVEDMEVAKNVLAYLSNDIIVGHHIGFDVLMINNLLKSLHLPKLKNMTLDTAHLIRRVENPLNAYNLIDQNEYSLDDLSQRFDIVTKQRHTAAGDAYITALVFIKLLELLKQRGVVSLKDLLRR